MSRATESVRDSIRYSRTSMREQEEQHYGNIAEAQSASTRQYGSQYNAPSQTHQVQNQHYHHQPTAPMPKPRQQVPQGANNQYSAVNYSQGYSAAHYIPDPPKKSTFMNEVYKTASPGTSKNDRQDLIQQHTWTPNGKDDSGGFPWFTILITLAQTGYFFYMYWSAVGAPSSEWALWQSAFNDNKLILAGDKATVDKEIWRFFTYSFVHSGWQHLLGNMIMQLVVGSLLEIVHGTTRIMIIYTIGVIVGGITAVVITPSIHLVGASGGDFCLVTTVLAGVVLNCDSMNLAGALIRIILFGGYLVAEGYMSVQRYKDGDHQISWAAHLGGAVTGLLIGTVVLRNMDIKKCENVCRILSLILFIGYLGVLTAMWFLIVEEGNGIDDGIDSIKHLFEKEE